MAVESPRVLLVGAGRFGIHHLANWRALEQAGHASLVGVVVQSERSRRALSEAHSIPVYTSLDDSLLSEVHAVDVVTPPPTHTELVSRCLEHAHVLVEKPLAPTVQECQDLARLADERRRVLMVGHIYRYNPLILRLAELIRGLPERPRAIEGTLVNPAEDVVARADASLEFLHLFDVIDLLFGVEPDLCVGADRSGARHVSLRYPGGMNAFLTLGWKGGEKQRCLRLVYADSTIDCDFLENSIVISRRYHQVDKIFLDHDRTALASELLHFIRAVQRRESEYPDGRTAARIVGIASRSIPNGHRPRRARPRVAVLGAGIFGATCAAELAPFCDVAVFERHDDIMSEVSFVNQWRHHSGFHYPRSYDQIQEIKSAREEFESVYGDAVIRKHPAYFCTSATGVEIPAPRYLAACKSNELAFTIEHPPEHVVDRSMVSLAVRSDEGIYDYFRLKAIAAQRIREAPSVRLCLNSEAVAGELLSDGVKRLTIRTPRGDEAEDFEYVVNATYANRNLLASWFRFPVEPLRFDLYEMLVLRIDIEPICVTIMDGPFTSLVTMGYDNLFMLSHIHDSVHKSLITEDGLPPSWDAVHSNRENMLAHASKYLPVLQRAEVVESRFATRAVNAFAKDFDARPTVVAAQGFGCWSILGGKIITCVQDTRRVAAAIRAEATIR